jgi:hypothetical protein
MRYATCMLVLGGLAGVAFAQATATGTATAAGGEDYWVEPMQKVHARFTGQRGAVAQFGDSITITMAFFVPLRSAEVRNLPPDLKEAHQWLRSYVQSRCWAGWKGGDWGNDGGTTTDWGLANMDGWLKKTNPEMALVMWGTNDTYRGPHPPKYTDNLRAIIQKVLDNGTVPILYTIPPVGDQTGNPKKTELVESFVQAAREVAREKKVPLIDFYKEMMTRQPADFAKTLLGDNLHPSYPQEYEKDFSETGLKNSGYTLRNYLTLKKMWEVNQKVLTKVEPARALAPTSTFAGPAYRGRPAVFVPKVEAAPVVDGRLDEPAWQKAQVLEFRMLDGDTKTPTNPTEARVISTDKALYVGFRCRESDMEGLAASKRARDSGIWQDDAVEVFLLPNAKPSRQYYHLIVNPEGSFYDDFNSDPKAWEGNPKLAVAKGKDFWSVEIEIPWSDLKLPPEPAVLSGPWRLNLNRGRPARGAYTEETALAPTEDPSSHVPEMFAYAFFEVFGGKMPPQAATGEAK